MPCIHRRRGRFGFQWHWHCSQSRLAMISHLAQYSGWIGLVGYLVLVAGCTVKTK